MKILVTGAKSFIGTNLIAELINQSYTDIIKYDQDTDPALLDHYCENADFVFHLADTSHLKENTEGVESRSVLTSEIFNALKKYNNACPVIIVNNIKNTSESTCGKLIKAEKDPIFDNARKTGTKVVVYRFPNTFGKWCRPNYNNTVAKFCHNIAHDLPLKVNDPDEKMDLVYIDDVVNELLNALRGNENKVGDFCEAQVVYTVTLGKIVDMIYSFKEARKELSVPDMGDQFAKKLYSTYLSYLPLDQFSCYLKMNIDEKGSFTEFIKTPDRGQVSINISKPGTMKGNHWHHSKSEKFIVVSGKGVVRFRKFGSDEVIEYPVSGNRLEAVDIPPGYTHNIENTGNENMVTIIWANEPFNPELPDTYFLEV